MVEIAGKYDLSEIMAKTDFISVFAGTTKTAIEIHQARLQIARQFCTGDDGEIDY